VVTIDDFSPLQQISNKKPKDGKKARKEKDNLRVALEQCYREMIQMPDDDDTTQQSNRRRYRGESICATSRIATTED
jgi:hypothetical protein